MTELLPHDPASLQFLPPSAVRGGVWNLSQQIAQTEMVPQNLRGKPEAIMAVMLAARELGIGPMHGLRAINIIKGQTSIAPELLHGLALRSGHDLDVVENTRASCTVEVRRAEWPVDRVRSVTFDVVDARIAGLVGQECDPSTGAHKQDRTTRSGNPTCACGQGWVTYPRAMMRARAVAEAVRAHLPDVAERAGYVSSEVGRMSDGEQQWATQVEEALDEDAPGDAEGGEDAPGDDGGTPEPDGPTPCGSSPVGRTSPVCTSPEGHDGGHTDGRATWPRIIDAEEVPDEDDSEPEESTTQQADGATVGDVPALLSAWDQVVERATAEQMDMFRADWRRRGFGARLPSIPADQFREFLLGCEAILDDPPEPAVPTQPTTREPEPEVDGPVALHTGSGWYVLDPPHNDDERVRGEANVPDGYRILEQDGAPRPDEDEQDAHARYTELVKRLDDDLAAQVREFAASVCEGNGDPDDPGTWAWLDTADGEAILAMAREVMDTQAGRRLERERAAATNVDQDGDEVPF